MISSRATLGMRYRILLLGCALATSCTALRADEASPTFTAEQRQFFQSEIQPLLKNKCLGCHGEGKKLESAYDMRTRDGLIRGCDIGAAVVLGKAEESPLY